MRKFTNRRKAVKIVSILRVGLEGYWIVYSDGLHEPVSKERALELARRLKLEIKPA